MDFLFLGYQTVSLGVSKPVFGWLILSFTLSCQQILQKSTQKSSDPKIQKSKFHENFQKLIFAFLEVGNSKYTLFKLFKHVLRLFWPHWEDLIFFHFWDITYDLGSVFFHNFHHQFSPKKKFSQKLSFDVFFLTTLKFMF